MTTTEQTIQTKITDEGEDGWLVFTSTNGNGWWGTGVTFPTEEGARQVAAAIEEAARPTEPRSVLLQPIISIVIDDQDEPVEVGIDWSDSVVDLDAYTDEHDSDDTVERLGEVAVVMSNRLFESRVNLDAAILAALKED